MTVKFDACFEAEYAKEPRLRSETFRPANGKHTSSSLPMIDHLRRSLQFLDRHSGLISAIGLVLAAIGILLTLRYIRLYTAEIASHRSEQERLAWERMLRLLNQVAFQGAIVNLSSKVTGFLPPDVAARYGPASEALLSYWHQLRVEVNIMPESKLTEKIEAFIAKYESSDSRASDGFLKSLYPIAHEVTDRAQKSFKNPTQKG